MGYEVHVTRAAHWHESETAPISLEEWLTYVAADPDMRLDGAADADLPDGSVLRYENDGLAVWTAYSRHGEVGNMAWFDYQDGQVVVKNPDDEILSKLCSIGKALGARVQGDDGEFYPRPESSAQVSTGALPEFLARPYRAVRNLFRRGAPLTDDHTKFKKGQRYRYLLGKKLCTVVHVDPRAEHGLGVLTVEFDDGHRLSMALVGSVDSMFLPPD